MYARKVVSKIDCSYSVKLRLKEDIAIMLEERSSINNSKDPIFLLGSTTNLANELKENLDEYKSSDIDIKSNIRIFGLPLFHITNRKDITAKGIIAIGLKSIGVISVGCFSTGFISFGAITAGVISFGSISIALLYSIGGIAIAPAIAIGGIAIAKSLAIGGLAVAKEVSFGGITCSKLMAYKDSFIIPGNLDEGSAVAYQYPTFIDDFKRDARVIFSQNYNFIKLSIINALR